MVIDGAEPGDVEQVLGRWVEESLRWEEHGGRRIRVGRGVSRVDLSSAGIRMPSLNFVSLSIGVLFWLVF